ncbi:Eukaryotic aspartyl protease family protein [Striga hermonthica]|uniref:Eukaryotic aspartyl protease family protein n=1 Tax=Striga hermonthica TaxID=68872 RepID=A0A9N7R9D4_STRHE|nr:Eukaryotic aspartyl protease family protein [Striga hermonthica]
MVCSSQYHLSLFLLLLLSLFFTLSSSHSHSITLSLSSPTKTHHLSAAIDRQWQQLLQKAAHESRKISSISPIFASRDGVYTFPLNFGTPPQTLPFALTSSGDLTSFPCEANYSCVKCTVDPKDIIVFMPNQSNSSSLVHCDDPLLNNTVSSNLIPVCTECISDDSCSNQLAEYADDEDGSIATSGVILSETLTLPRGEKEPAKRNILVGCASKSEGWPQGIGIVGFGRVPSSLASQLNLTKFSHCFVSKRYEGNHNVSGALVLTWGEDNDERDQNKKDTKGIRYTPLRKFKNATWQNACYYVDVEKIVVGRVKVEVPKEYLVADEAGIGGMMVEAGYTVSFMDKHVFEPLVREFVKQVGKKYKRAKEVEKEFTYKPCYNIGSKGIKGMPKMGFGFEGGVELVVPLENFFSYWNDSVICMTILSDDNETTGDELDGPAIVLGQWQMQNVYVEYDLANNRLGLQLRSCSKGS